jgi:hypothetical protein
MFRQNGQKLLILLKWGRMDSPIILLTSFWDADKIIGDKQFTFKKDSIFRLMEYPMNYDVFSIALAHPSLEKLKHIQTKLNFGRLDFFCPTYRILMDYKNGGNWDDYVKEYRVLLRKNKKEIMNWMDSLSNNRLYILCCWENISKGANCHRKILHDVFVASKSVCDRAVYILR